MTVTKMMSMDGALVGSRVGHAAGVALARLLAIALLLMACGGGGGGGGDGDDPPPEDVVTITGVVDGGGDDVPIPNARCRFVDMGGDEHDSDDTDAAGTYRLYVTPGVRGYILVTPPTATHLTLAAFSSTRGLGAGSVKAQEHISPATTIVADIIRYESPADPEGRKAELLDAIETQRDPNLSLVVTMAARLYRSMFSRGINAQFSASRDSGDGGGRSDSDVDGGGAQGDAGDGADFSPLGEAECEFVYGPTLEDGEPCYSTALGDFFGDGALNRPDLEGIAEEVSQGYDSEPLQQAFTAVFPQGIGAPVATTAAADGSYALPAPPNVEGFVRCIPKDRDHLVLATYLPARDPGETLTGQDVTPATTVFSALIAPALPEAERLQAKANYLDDIAGLDVQIQGDSENLTGFRLRPGTAPDNERVGLVAFSATALFNAFNKNDLDIDFLAAIEDLRDNQAVNPSFLSDQGVPADQTQPLADMVNTSITETGGQLDTNLGEAVSTGRLRVTVSDGASGEPLAGAHVDIESALTCEDCPATSAADRPVELTLSGLGAAPASAVVIVSGVPGYTEARVATQAVAFATVDVAVALASDVVDSENPAVSITLPAGTPYETDSDRVDIHGTASDDVGVVEVRWANDRGGDGVCNGTENWRADGIALQEGTNHITITARDAVGNTASVAVSVVYTPANQTTYDYEAGGTYTYDGNGELVLYFQYSDFPEYCGPSDAVERFDVVFVGSRMYWYDPEDGQLDVSWYRISGSGSDLDGIWEGDDNDNGHYRGEFVSDGSFIAYGNCN